MQLMQYYLEALYLHVTRYSIELALKAEEIKDTTVLGIDLSIEGLRSQKYSVGIFVFLIISLIFFSIIIYFYIPKGDKKLKTGEKIMFGAIIMGIFIAIGVGWLQLIEGYLL